jgi:hypothetical protein
VLASAWTAGPAHARDPFDLSVQTTAGAPESLTVSDSNLPDLVDELVKAKDRLATFQNKPVAATLNYGGVRDAIRFDQNAAGTSATLSIPLVGFSRTFTGPTRGNVRDQIVDFLLKESANPYARLLRQVNERSTVGVTDGNPLAATALMADGAYLRFGLHPGPMHPEPRELPDQGAGLRFDFDGGYAQTDDPGDGYFASAHLSTLFRLSERVGLSFALPFQYRDVQGAQVYYLGGEIALPILLVGGDYSDVEWTLTPAFLSAASGSLDLAAGGTFLGGGVTSSLHLHFGRSTMLTVANQISFFEGFPIDVGELHVNTDLSQQVVKNGVLVTQALGDRAFIDGGVTLTNFLQDAAIGQYLTPEAGVGLMFNDRAGLRVAYRGDFADGFTSHGGTVQLFFNY